MKSRIFTRVKRIISALLMLLFSLSIAHGEFSIKNVETNSSAVSIGETTSNMLPSNSFAINNPSDNMTLLSEEDKEPNSFIEPKLRSTPYNIYETMVVDFVINTSQDIIQINHDVEGFGFLSLKNIKNEENIIQVQLMYLNPSDQFRFSLFVELDTSEVLVSNVYGYITELGLFITLASSDNIQSLILECQLEEGVITKSQFDKLLLEQENLSIEYVPQEYEKVAFKEFMNKNTSSSISSFYGRWRWEATDGTLHALRNTYVALCVNGSIREEGYTDDDGYYAFNFTLTKTSNVYVLVRSKGENNRVRKSFLYDSYSAKTETVAMSIGSNQGFYCYLSNSETDFKAFQVSQALNIGNKYVSEMSNGDIPFALAKFPSSSSCYNTFFGLICVTEEAYAFWDIVLHEYGHCVQHYFDLDDSPGGYHNIDVDQIAIHGKDKGTRLAWGEGWATFFAIIATQYYGNSLIEIPYVNDTLYNSYGYDSSGTYYLWSKNLETNWNCGEGCERSIFAALYDLYDDSPFESGDDIALGHQNMWDAVIASKPRRFSDFHWKIVSTYYTARDGKIGAILAMNGMTSTNFRISSGGSSLNNPPTFAWTAGGTTGYSFNRFQLVIYNDLNTFVTISYLTTTSYTLSGSEWSAIMNGSEPEGSNLYAILYVWQTDLPQTGFYNTMRITFIKPTHTHSYDYHYSQHNLMYHKSYCSCGDYILKEHSWIKIPYYDGNSVGLQQYCPDCGQLGFILLISHGVKGEFFSDNCDANCLSCPSNNVLLKPFERLRRLDRTRKSFLFLNLRRRVC